MTQVEPIIKRDANGKPIYSRNSWGFEFWYEYDAKSKCIHYRDNRGLECWWEYDSNGNEVHYKNNHGDEEWYYEGERTTDPVKILLLQKRLRDKVSLS